MQGQRRANTRKVPAPPPPLDWVDENLTTCIYDRPSAMTAGVGLDDGAIEPGSEVTDTPKVTALDLERLRKRLEEGSLHAHQHRLASARRLHRSPRFKWLLLAGVVSGAASGLLVARSPDSVQALLRLGDNLPFRWRQREAPVVLRLEPERPFADVPVAPVPMPIGADLAARCQLESYFAAPVQGPPRFFVTVGAFAPERAKALAPPLSGGSHSR